jgi:hypothetical protein
VQAAAHRRAGFSGSRPPGCSQEERMSAKVLIYGKDA